jgi:myo-inositol 2-dehydrogenase/D-chiro-inositol 1-dehydrogenase
MSDGTLVVVGGGWNLPPSFPNYCATWIEITGTEGALILDDTSRDNWLNTVKDGTQFPMSTMPGEDVDHMYAGQMGPETIHFLEAVLLDKAPLTAPEHARMVMESYLAADISADCGDPIGLPLSNHSLALLADMKAKL